MKISYNNLRDQAIDLVMEKGEDYRGYPGAYFRPDGAPGCLLGELVAKTGATHTELGIKGINKSGVSQLNSMGYLVPADDATRMVLHRLQNLNDHGHTWFTAVCSAFGMTEHDLREEIAIRRNPARVTQFDTDAYVDWVSSYAEDTKKKVVNLSLPVHTPVAPHVLAA